MYSKEYLMKDGKISSINLNEVKGTKGVMSILSVNISDIETDDMIPIYMPSFSFFYPTDYKDLSEDKIIALFDLNQSYLSNLEKNQFSSWLDSKLIKQYGKYYTGKIIY